MNKRIAGCLVGAFVAGLALLPACAAPAGARAAGRGRSPWIFPRSRRWRARRASSSRRSPRRGRALPPSAADLAYHAMLAGDGGHGAGRSRRRPEGTVDRRRSATGPRLLRGPGRNSRSRPCSRAPSSFRPKGRRRGRNPCRRCRAWPENSAARRLSAPARRRRTPSGAIRP